MRSWFTVALFALVVCFGLQRLSRLAAAAPSEIQQDLRRFLIATFLFGSALITLMFVHSNYDLADSVAWPVAAVALLVWLAAVILGGRHMDQYWAAESSTG